MAIEVAQLYAKIGTDTSEARRDLEHFDDRLERTADNLEKTARQTDKFGDSLEKQGREADKGADKAREYGEAWVGALRRIGEVGVDSTISAMQALTNAAGDFVRAGIESYGINQQLTQSFSSLVAAELMQKDATLTRNEALELAAKRSEELLQWNSQLAINSPFSEEGVARALRMSMAYGFNSEEAQRLTQTLIDTTVAMGGSEDMMQRTALALGQIQARGKTSAEEFNQLSEAGINARQILADAFNVPISQIEKLNESGKLTADIVIPAIIERLERDFGGAAEASAGTVLGLQNALGELYSITGRKLLDDSIEAALPYVERFVELMQEPETQAQIERLSAALGEFVSNSLAELVDTGGMVIDRTREIYSTLEPLISFVAENAIPIIGGLATAYGVTLVQSLVAALPQMVAMSGAAIVQAGALGAIALAAGGVIIAYQNLVKEEEKYSSRLVDQLDGYQASMETMEAYNKLSDEQKKKLRENAQAIIEQQERMRAFAQQGLRDSNGLFGVDEEAAQRTIDGLKSANITLDAMNAHFAEQVRLAAEADKAQGDLNETLAGTGDAAGEATGGIDLMAEANARAQQELDALALRGQEAYERINESSEEYYNEEQRRQQQHNAQIQQFYADYEKTLLDAEAAANEKRLEIREKYRDAAINAQASTLARLADLEEKEHERALNSQEKYLNDANKLIERWNEQVARYNEERLKAEEDYQAKVADLREKEVDRADKAFEQLTERLAKHEERRLELERDYLDKREAANIASNERYQALYERQQDDYESYLSARAKLDEEYAYEAEQRERKLQDKILDIRENLQYKLEDLRRNAEYKSGDRAVDFEDKQADQQRDLADKLADIDRQIARASSHAEQEKLLAKRAAMEEEARIAMERAERDYQIQLERDARDLQRAEEQARREAERAEEQARQQAERAEREAQIELERARRALETKRAAQLEAYEKEYSDLQEKHNRELIEIDRRYATEHEKLAKQEEEIRAAYERQESEAAESLQRQLEKLEDAYNKQLATLQDKLDKERSEHDKAMAELEAAYAEREAKAQASYERDVAKQREALEQKLADIRDAYAKELNEQQNALDKQNAVALEKLNERIAQQNKKFEEQRNNAALAYSEEQAALRENLGKQLYDYVAAQARMNDAAKEAALQRQALIAMEYGYDPAAKVAEFNQRYNDFILSSAIPNAVASTPPISAPTFNINAGMIVPMSDFTEYINEQLRQLNALNGGILNTGAMN